MKRTHSLAHRRLFGWIFSAPALAFFALLMLFPVVAVVVLSFTSWTGFDLTQADGVGAANYEALVADGYFRGAFLHTVVLLVITTVLMNVAGIAAALLIHRRMRGSELLRVAMFIPLGLSPIITAVIWSRMLGPFGLINSALGDLGLVDSPVDFLGAPNSAFATLTAAYIWQFAGYNMLLYYAALQSLPGDRLEAAAVDGANKWQQFRHVTLPYLRPVVAVVVVLNLIGGWKIFDLVYVLTGGGPNRATDVLGTYLYEVSFRNSQVGYASAIAVVIIVLAILSSLLRRPIAGEEMA